MWPWSWGYPWGWRWPRYWGVTPYGYGWPWTMPRDQEIVMLEDQERCLTRDLNVIRKRLEELKNRR